MNYKNYYYIALLPVLLNSLHLEGFESRNKRNVKVRGASALVSGAACLYSMYSNHLKNKALFSKREGLLALSTIYLSLLAGAAEIQNRRYNHKEPHTSYDYEEYFGQVLLGGMIGGIIGAGLYVNSRESSDNFLVELIDFGKMIGYGALGGLVGLSLDPIDNLLAKIKI
jgi:hypothetical protein